MIDFSYPAKEIFEILKSFGYTQIMYDVDGNRSDDPSESRRFFVQNKNILVSMKEDSENSCVTMYVGKDTSIADILNLIQTLRTTSSKYKLLFHVRRYGKEISPKDFANLQESIEKEQQMNIFEGMYGTLGTSYLKLENAKMTVKHSRKSDDPKVRAQCIESIIIEDSTGDKYTFPTNHLVPAKAMTQHFNHGGGFADVVGQQISRMAMDYRSLAGAVNQVSGLQQGSLQAVAEPAALEAVQEACKSQLRTMRESFSRMALSESYLSETSSLAQLNESEETDEETPEDALDEMSDLLTKDGKKCPKKVAEAACKAMKKEGKILKEYLTRVVEAPENMVSIFGKKIDGTVWNNFKQGVMNTRGTPNSDSNKTFSNKLGELAYKLSALVPHIENDALGNLLGAVSEKLPEVQNDKVRTQFMAIAQKALKNANMSINEGLIMTPVLREYQEWIKSFDILNEGEFVPFKKKEETDECDTELKEDDDSDEKHFGLENSADNDLTEADVSPMVSILGTPIRASIWDSFKNGILDLVGDPEDADRTPSFVNKSAKMLYQLGNLIPHIKDDSLGNLLNKVAEQLPVEKDPEVLKQLRAIASKAVRNVEDSTNSESVNEDDDAYQLLDEVGDDEDIHSNNVIGDEVQDAWNDIDDGSNDGVDILSRSDIMYPSGNMNNSFRSEVLSKTVPDPVTGEEENTDGDYLSKLRTLSGLTTATQFDVT